MADNEERCSNCRFWRRHYEQDYGHCHRHAPVLKSAALEHCEMLKDNKEDFTIDGEITFYHGFPVTEEYDWCGEYEANSHG